MTELSASLWRRPIEGRVEEGGSMKKRLTIAVVTLVPLVGFSESALGGGVSSLDLDTHYLVGSSEVISQPVYFRNARAARTAMHHDWDLYLTAGWTEPVHAAPPDDAYPAGELLFEISPMSNVLRAEARVTIPEMPFGRYDFLVCSDIGCSSMVGDLYIPPITIVESAGHAWMLRRIEKMQTAQRRAQRRLKEVRGLANDLRDDAADSEDAIRELVAGRDRLRDRVRTLEEAEPIRSNPILPWMITGGAMTLLLTGAVLRRRRLAPQAWDPEEDTAPGAAQPAEPKAEPMSMPDGGAPVFDDSMWQRPKEPIDSN
jgi:hypothetical protein